MVKQLLEAKMRLKTIIRPFHYTTIYRRLWITYSIWNINDNNCSQDSTNIARQDYEFNLIPVSVENLYFHTTFIENLNKKHSAVVHNWKCKIMMSLTRITHLWMQCSVTMSIVICLFSVTAANRLRQNTQKIVMMSGLTTRRFSFNLFVKYGLAWASLNLNDLFASPTALIYEVLTSSQHTPISGSLN